MGKTIVCVKDIEAVPHLNDEGKPVVSLRFMQGSHQVKHATLLTAEEFFMLATKTDGALTVLARIEHARKSNLCVDRVGFQTVGGNGKDAPAACVLGFQHAGDHSFAPPTADDAENAGGAETPVTPPEAERVGTEGLSIEGDTAIVEIPAAPEDGPAPDETPTPDETTAPATQAPAPEAEKPKAKKKKKAKAKA